MGTDLLKNSALTFPVYILGEGRLTKFVSEHMLQTYQVKGTEQVVPDTMKEVGANPTGNWAQVFYACN